MIYFNLILVQYRVVFWIQLYKYKLKFYWFYIYYDFIYIKDIIFEQSPLKNSRIIKIHSEIFNFSTFFQFHSVIIFSWLQLTSKKLFKLKFNENGTWKFKKIKQLMFCWSILFSLKSFVLFYKISLLWNVRYQ